MVNKSENVAVAVTGAVYRGKPAAVAPTGIASVLSPTEYDEMGWVNEDGVSIEMPGAGDSETIKGWQNGATVRTISTPPEDNPKIKFTLLETKKEVIEAALEVTITQTATDGAYVLDTTAPRGRRKWVVDAVDGAELSRRYAPLGEVVELGEIKLAHGEATAYEVTIECHRDTALAGQMKVWESRLKTP